MPYMETNEKTYYERQHELTHYRILRSAKTLLLDRGFSEVTMGEIARAAGLSRQRVYLYFSNIDEIIYEIQTLDMEAFISGLTGVLSERTGTAEHDLLRLADAVFQYEQTHSEDFLFTGEFDVFYRRRKVSEALRERYARTFTATELARQFGLLLREGQRGGEFRADFDADDATAYWHNIMQLICERIAVFRVNGEAHTETEREKTIANFKASLLSYLK